MALSNRVVLPVEQIRSPRPSCFLGAGVRPSPAQQSRLASRRVIERGSRRLRCCARDGHTPECGRPRRSSSGCVKTGNRERLPPAPLLCPGRAHSG